MKCTRAEYLISALISGDAGADEEKSLREHIDECLQCKAVYDMQQAIEAELQGLQTPVPDPGFAKRTAQLAGDTGQLSTVRPRFRMRHIISWIGVEGVIGICVALIVGLTWVIMGRGFTDLIERAAEWPARVELSSQGWVIGVAVASLIISGLIILKFRKVVRDL